jgi:hypothetical protein
MAARRWRCADNPIEIGQPCKSGDISHRYFSMEIRFGCLSMSNIFGGRLFRSGHRFFKTGLQNVKAQCILRSGAPRSMKMGELGDADRFSQGRESLRQAPREVDCLVCRTFDEGPRLPCWPAQYRDFRIALGRPLAAIRLTRWRAKGRLLVHFPGSRAYDSKYPHERQRYVVTGYSLTPRSLTPNHPKRGKPSIQLLMSARP